MTVGGVSKNARLSNANKAIKNSKGFLSAWIVTDKGGLYFRKNVSHANAEGNMWLNIFLPNQPDDEETGLVTKCSCSSTTGKLVVATSRGDFFVRTGITHEHPWGNEWLVVKKVILGLGEIFF